MAKNWEKKVEGPIILKTREVLYERYQRNISVLDICSVTLLSRTVETWAKYLNYYSLYNNL